MLVLGIHDGHNGAACLLRDGAISGALQEERIRRVKNYSGFPQGACEALLRHAGASWADVDAVALAGRESYLPAGETNDRDAQIHAYKNVSTPTQRLRGVLRRSRLRRFVQERRLRERVGKLASLGVPRERVSVIEHHRCHASATHYGGGADPDALVITLDGAGDGVCATVSVPHGREAGLSRLSQVGEEHSVGILWALVTSMLGMVPLEHEYKMMGMAPYAKPERARATADVFSGGFAQAGGTWRRRSGVPEISYSYEYWRRALELTRFDDVCAGLQLFTEEFFARWVRHWLQETGRRKLRLSGGMFMNVKMNKVLGELAEVDDIWIFPSCGDETNSLGAAWALMEDRGLANDIEPLGPFCLGVPPDEADYAKAAARARDLGFDVSEPSDMDDAVASRLADGQVVARFDGPEEFGARALGHRSILADPSRPELIRVINDAIKNRDFWMPFACSMLESRASRYLVNPKGFGAPYMILTFDSAHTAEIAAGTHPQDGTVRPQLVDDRWSPGYHRLLERFESKTGRGALLNTSLNLHGEPIVSSPPDAIDVMQRSGLSCLALGRYLVAKRRD